MKTNFLNKLMQRLLLLLLLLKSTTSATADTTVFKLTDLHCYQAAAPNSLKIMKLTIRRYGGYAGTDEVLVALESKSLSADQEAALRALLERMQRLLPLEPGVGADFVHYEILVEQGGTQHTLVFTDDLSEQARQLVELTNQIVAIGGKLR
jgi:emfourin